MLHNIIIQNIQTLKLNKIQSTPISYTHITATSATTPTTTSGTSATISSSPSMVNLPIMHLFQHILQMLSFLIPSQHHTTGHHNIDMVFDAAHPSATL